MVSWIPDGITRFGGLFGLAVSVSVSGLGCKREIPEVGVTLPLPPEAPPSIAVSAPEGDAGPPVGPPRCGALAPPIAITAAPSGASATARKLSAVGGVAWRATDIFVGALLEGVGPGAPSSATSAGLVRVSGTDAKRTATYVPLGQADPDAPAPLPVVRGTDLFAFFYGSVAASGAPSNGSAPGASAPAPKGTRPLRIVRVEGDTPIEVGTVKTSRDASFGFDGTMGPGGGFVVWDEDVPKAARGEVRSVALGPTGAIASVPIVLTPESSDADTPKVIARQGGAWVAWIARRVEGPLDAGKSPVRDPKHLEGPGELPAFTWVEVAAIDTAGAVVAPARAVTKLRGRVGDFSLGVAGDTLYVYVRDDEARKDDVGGQIVRVSVPLAGPAPGAPKNSFASASTVLVSDGVGVGDVDVFDVRGGAFTAAPGGGRWLLFSDPSDALRMVRPNVPEPSRTLSREPGLTGARPLAIDLSSTPLPGPASSSEAPAATRGSAGSSGITLLVAVPPPPPSRAGADAGSAASTPSPISGIELREVACRAP